MLDNYQRWSSPAFLKRSRLSGDALFDFESDDDDKDGPDKKRRRTYDWKVWKYTPRTPSPEKEDVEAEFQMEMDATPIRRNQSPRRRHQSPITPTSPSGAASSALAASTNANGKDSTTENQQPELSTSSKSLAEVATVQSPDDARRRKTSPVVRDADYYDLYAGPNEFPPSGMQFGDTEPNTEEESDSETHPAPAGAAKAPSMQLVGSTPSKEQPTHPAADASPRSEQGSPKPSTGPEEHISTPEPPVVVMPPPNLPSLLTSFQPEVPELLTPIGQQPQSPVILPLDSSTLPMPSPFPGERVGNTAISYFEESLEHSARSNTNQVDHNEKESTTVSTSIMESSFYSSLGPEYTPFGTTHESAFTDLRFTFGMDGSSTSHAKETAGPPVQNEGVKATSPKRFKDRLDNQEENVDTQKQVNSSEQHVSAPDVPENAAEAGADDGEEQMETSEEWPEGFAEELAEELAEEIAEEVAEELQGDGLGALPPGLIDELREEFREEFANQLAQDELQQEAAFEIQSPESQQSNVFQDLTNEDAHSEAAESTPMDVDQPVAAHQQTPKPPKSPPQPLLPSTGSDEDVASRQNRPPQSTVEIIDLGSPSGGESDEDEDVDHNNMRTHSSESVVRETSEIERSTPSNEETFTTLAHPETKQAPDTKTSTDDAGLQSTDDVQQLRKDEVDETMVDVSTSHVKAEIVHDHGPHPDIKMESIEDNVMFPTEDDYGGQDETSKSGVKDEAEVLIAVPEGHKMGELKYKAVAGTAPARNTRSKTKPTVSPVTTFTASPEPRAQSRRSKSTRASTRQTPARPTTPMKLRSGTAVSPSPKVSASATSPSQTVSPYRTRSQAKASSLERSFSPMSQAGIRRTTRARRGSTAEVTETDDHLHPMESFGNLSFPSFEPSQELGLPSGKFRNVPYVKDSEEGSLHSEHSLSTVPFSSDDHEGYRVYGLSDGLDPAYATKSSPHQRTTPRRKTQQRPMFSPPARKLSFTSGQDNHPRSDEENDRDATPKAAKSNIVHLSSSPPRAPDSLRSVSRSPSAPRYEKPSTTASANQFSLMNSNMPITPDATQQTFTQSQPTFNQLEPSLPMTPQLTQATSAGLDTGSFKPPPSPSQLLSSPNRITRSQAHAIHQQQTRHSEDLSESENETESQLAASLPAPSIGLSTPTSYYTPLKDLTYFLGRPSPQFHTSSTPDVLALVVSATTPPKRADKGPRHYNTTLQITDISTFPEVTTVQIFRAFSSALPVAEVGDVVLLRQFQVKSLNRRAALVSGEESAWCVWRWGKKVWGVKRGECAEVRAREEIRGPSVEMGVAEWREVERVRGWWVGAVRGRVGEMGKEKGAGEDGEEETMGEGQNGEMKSPGKVRHGKGKGRKEKV